MNRSSIRLTVCDMVAMIAVGSGGIAVACVIFGILAAASGDLGGSVVLTGLAALTGLLSALTWWLHRLFVKRGGSGNGHCGDGFARERVSEDPVGDDEWDVFLSDHEQELPSRTSVWLARLRTSRTEADR